LNLFYRILQCFSEKGLRNQPNSRKVHIRYLSSTDIITPTLGIHLNLNACLRPYEWVFVAASDMFNSFSGCCIKYHGPLLIRVTCAPNVAAFWPWPS
jgi:hypothetical protein